MRILQLLLIAGTTLSLLVACGAPRMSRGALDVTVVNLGERPIYDVQVEYESQAPLAASALNAGEASPKQRYYIEPDSSIRISYSTPDNRTVEREYVIHARPQEGGRMEFRIDREGGVVPVSRFDIH